MQNYNKIERIFAYFYDDSGEIIAKNLQTIREAPTLKKGYVSRHQ